MKKYRPATLILALVLSFVLAACGGTDAPSSPGTSSPGTSSNDSSGGDPTGGPSPPSDDGETYSLTLSYFAPETVGPGMFSTYAAEQIAERSGGRLTLDCYFNGTLLSFEDTINGAINGVADIVWIDSTNIGEVFPLHNLFAMPYEKTPPGSKATLDAVYNQMLVDIPEFSEELAAVNLRWLGMMAIGGYHLHGTGTALDTPATLSGKTIEALAEGANVVTNLGGKGTVLDSGDFYLSLSTGLCQGQICNTAGLWGFKTYEVLTTHTLFSNSDDPTDYDVWFGGGLYAPIMGTVMNLESFNQLPADLQAVVLEVFAELPSWITEADMPTQVQPAVDAILERGDPITIVNDEIRAAEWWPGMKPVIDNWLAAVEAEGHDGQAIYDHLMELFADAAS